ncbi:MAG: sensor histidine kinase [Flavobacteriaceae bacterium]
MHTSHSWSNRFKFTIYTIGKLAFLIHAALVLFFACIGVKEMVVYNVLSSLFFIAMMYLVKKEVSVKIIFFLMCLEVVLHAYLSTYYVGSECNFILFIFVLPSVFLLNPKWETWEKILFFLNIALLYLLNIGVFKTHEPQYKLNEKLVFYTEVTLILTVVLMIFIVVSYYTKLVNTNDAALRKANKKLQAKNEEKKLIIKEIHHRIKNNLQVVISLLRLQASKIDDNDVVTMFKNTQNRIFSMALLHENLLQEYDLEFINAHDHFKYLSENLIDSYAVDNKVEVEIAIENIEFAMQTLTPLGLILNELITNSLKHAFKQTSKGKIRIALKEIEGKKYELLVSDNGSGIVSKTKSNGLGTKLVSIFVKQLNGTLELTTKNGTAYKIIFEEIEHT